MHAATVGTLRHLLAPRVTPATEHDRAHAEEQLARPVREVANEEVEASYAERGYTGEEPAEATKASGMSTWRWSSTRRPRRAPRSCRAGVGCGAQLRLGGALPAAGQGLRAATRSTVARVHSVAFACLFLHRSVAALGPSPQQPPGEATLSRPSSRRRRSSAGRGTSARGASRLEII